MVDCTQTQLTHMLCPPSLQVDLTVNLVERKTGGLGAGTGISAAGRGSGNMPGFVGNFTYRWGCGCAGWLVRVIPGLFVACLPCSEFWLCKRTPGMLRSSFANKCGARLDIGQSPS